MKSLQKTLSNSQVSGSRKSRNGNIVLSFPSNQSLQNAQSTLSKNEKIKLHTHEKTLPKMTIRNVDIPDDEIKNSILMKNPKVRSLVDTGHFFDVLFVQKISLKNNNGSMNDYRNAIIKVDPAIRNIIKETILKFLLVSGIVLFSIAFTSRPAIIAKKLVRTQVLNVVQTPPFADIARNHIGQKVVCIKMTRICINAIIV